MLIGVGPTKVKAHKSFLSTGGSHKVRNKEDQLLLFLRYEILEKLVTYIIESKDFFGHANFSVLRYL